VRSGSRLSPLAGLTPASSPSCSTEGAASCALGQHARARPGTFTAPVFAAPPPSRVTAALIWSLLDWPMTAAPVPAALLGAALLGVLINHGNSGSRHGAGSHQ
jgi:hypothetical protein